MKKIMLVVGIGSYKESKKVSMDRKERRNITSLNQSTD